MDTPLPREPGIGLLSAHHLHALAMAVLIDRQVKVNPTRERVNELAGRVARFAEEELFGHFQVEETVLFPALRPVLDSGDLLDELIAHHRKMEDLVRRLAECPDQEQLALVKEFGKSLRRHIRMEEFDLFRQIDDRLDEARREELGREIDEAARANRLTAD